MKNFYKIGFFVLLLAIVGAGAFYYGQSKNVRVSPTPTPTTQIFVTGASTPQPTTTKTSLTRVYVKENLAAAINTGNTQAIESYMTDDVVVILQSTECCGKMSKAETMKQLSYIKDGTAPWNFDDANPIAAQLRANSPNYGDATSVIGIASNEYVVAFILNSENRVKGLTMAVTYKLVVP